MRLGSLVFALFAMVAASAAHAEDAFFAGLDDVPLPPGFAQSAGGWSFADDAGRIVEARARGREGGLVVRDFYYETLPALGWSVSPQADGTLVFVRGRERLTFSVRREGEATLIGARLVSASAPRD